MRGSARDLLANEGANSNDSRSAQARRGGSETECERNDVLIGNGGHQLECSRAGGGGLDGGGGCLQQRRRVWIRLHEAAELRGVCAVAAVDDRVREGDEPWRFRRADSAS